MVPSGYTTSGSGGRPIIQARRPGDRCAVRSAANERPGSSIRVIWTTRPRSVVGVSVPPARPASRPTSGQRRCRILIQLVQWQRTAREHPVLDRTQVRLLQPIVGCRGAMSTVHHAHAGAAEDVFVAGLLHIFGQTRPQQRRSVETPCATAVWPVFTEGVGFEPTERGLPSQRFSRRVAMARSKRRKDAVLQDVSRSGIAWFSRAGYRLG